MAHTESHDVVPVTMLSGFLGAGLLISLQTLSIDSLLALRLSAKHNAGKTTLLRHLLENTKLKIGCIVNDVATVNVDAKLIRNDRTRDRDQGNNTTSDLADTIELANGCACKRRTRERVAMFLLCCCGMWLILSLSAGCSIADELFTSFEQLLTLADRKGVKYDRCAHSVTNLCVLHGLQLLVLVTVLHTLQYVGAESMLPACRFVLENSGVAEPQNIRDNFSEAIAKGHPLMSRIQLDTMATIVDSGSFTADYSSRTPLSGMAFSLSPCCWLSLHLPSVCSVSPLLLNKTCSLRYTRCGMYHTEAPCFLYAQC